MPRFDRQLLAILLAVYAIAFFRLATGFWGTGWDLPGRAFKAMIYEQNQRVVYSYEPFFDIGIESTPNGFSVLLVLLRYSFLLDYISSTALLTMVFFLLLPMVFYLAGRLLWNRKAGLYAALLSSVVCGVPIYISWTTQYYFIGFSFFTLGIGLWKKKRIILLSVLLAALVYTHILTAAVFLLYMLTKFDRKLLRVLVVTAILCYPVILGLPALIQERGSVYAAFPTVFDEGKPSYFNTLYISFGPVFIILSLLCLFMWRRFRPFIPIMLFLFIMGFKTFFVPATISYLLYTDLRYMMLLFIPLTLCCAVALSDKRLSVIHLSILAGIAIYLNTVNLIPPSSAGPTMNDLLAFNYVRNMEYDGPFLVAMQPQVGFPQDGTCVSGGDWFMSLTGKRSYLMIPEGTIWYFFKANELEVERFQILGNLSNCCNSDFLQLLASENIGRILIPEGCSSSCGGCLEKEASFGQASLFKV
jgi:hypothetical protein